MDTGVWIKFLITEEPIALNDRATQLVLHALSGGRLVAPSFCWAEVGSVINKKVRQGAVHTDEAAELWRSFERLPIDYVESKAIRNRSWTIARQFALPTLYDAAFLASTELAPAEEGVAREFWTTDEALLRALVDDQFSYVRQL